MVSTASCLMVHNPLRLPTRQMPGWKPNESCCWLHPPHNGVTPATGMSSGIAPPSLTNIASCQCLARTVVMHVTGKVPSHAPACSPAAEYSLARIASDGCCTTTSKNWSTNTPSARSCCDTGEPERRDVKSG